MKFAMNGALIIGTMDGANVEIAEAIGESNMFIFGATVTEVDSIRQRIHKGEYHIGNELREVFAAIRENRFGSAKDTVSLVETLESHDFYILCHDFYSYSQEHERVDMVYADVDNWTKMSVISALSVGKFSSDRTINEYAEEIWEIDRVPIPAPSDSAINRIRSQPHLVDAEERFERKKSRNIKREATIIKSIDEAELEETLLEKSNPIPASEFLDN